MTYQDQIDSVFRFAVEERYFNLAKPLLRIGANVNSKDPTNFSSPLLIALRNSDKPFMKFLLNQGADPNYKGHLEETGLHISSRKGNKEAVNILLKYGANANVKDVFGNTPLSDAILRNKREISSILAETLNKVLIQIPYKGIILEWIKKEGEPTDTGDPLFKWKMRGMFFVKKSPCKGTLEKIYFSKYEVEKDNIVGVISKDE